MSSLLLDFSTHPVAVISKWLGAEGSADFSREARESVPFSAPPPSLYLSGFSSTVRKTGWVGGAAACTELAKAQHSWLSRNMAEFQVGEW